MAQIVAATIAGVCAIVAAILGFFNQKKLREIHILVNSRLDQALEEIDDLKNQRDIKASQVDRKPESQ